MKKKLVEIRTGTPADIPSLQRLFLEEEDYHRALYPDYFKLSRSVISEKILQEEIRRTDSVYLVAVIDTRAIGVVHIREKVFSKEPQFKKVKYALIEDCIILEKHRRQGIAMTLIRAAQEWAFQRRLSRIQLQVWANNEPARKLYRKLGYHDLRAA